MEILPLDLESGEEPLKEAVQKAESFFSGAGVYYMVHNAAYERPVSVTVFFFSIKFSTNHCLEISWNHHSKILICT